MNLTELDEWQGLTAAMVREWLKRTGWELRTDEWGEQRWFNGNGRSIADKRVLVTDGFRWIASQYDQTVQSLLREINPRMRKGMPSEAAWRAHGEENGLWLCLWGEIPTNEQHWEMFFRGRPFVTKIRKYDAMWEWGIRGLSWADCPEMPHGSDFLFWPCDANGNKTRWLTDAEGKML